ncbi:MAG: hypothetical protein E7053_00765 [Lentisphaerae bacterium]|nr:hypothetical protein [Lentisphaerota bacterium]
MMKKLLFFAAGIISVLFCGCGHTPVRENLPAATPPYTADAETVAARSAGFKNIIAPAEIRGIGLFPASFAGRYANEDILDVVEALGFNRIYCQLTSEQELDDTLTAFLTAASQRNIPVEIVLSQQDFYHRYRGNRLIRNLFIQYPDLAEAVSDVVEYNLELPENIRIAGVTVILTPHLFNGDNTERIRGSLYRWDEKRYGTGCDNDMLMRQSLEYLRQISEIPFLPPLTVAIADFYHEKAQSGELSCGKISDFARYASRVIVISSANLPSRVPENSRQELADAGNGAKVIIAVPLATHTALDSGSLRRRNWQDFQRAIDFLIKRAAPHPAFQGIVISPLAVVEYLRQER